MIIHFEILHVRYHHNRGQLIAARSLSPSFNFEIKEGSLLGEIAVSHYKNMTIRDDDGVPMADIYIFEPLLFSLTKYFEKGQIVPLYLAD